MAIEREMTYKRDVDDDDGDVDGDVGAAEDDTMRRRIVAPC